jgi:predicted permease
MIELRQALRSLRRTPSYALTVVAVIAVAMALATTVFAVVDGVLFKALPYPEADRLYVGYARRANGRSGGVFKVDEIDAWRRALPSVPVAAFEAHSQAGTLGDGRIYGAASVDEHFFEVLGVRPAFGGFSAEHFEIGARGTVAIISHRLWQRAFRGRPDVFGQILPLAGASDHLGRSTGRPMIVGVLPADFVFPLATEMIDVIRPQVLTAKERAGRNESGVIALVRLPAGMSIETLRARLDAATSAVQPEDQPADRRVVGPSLRPMSDMGLSHRRSFRTLTFVTGSLVLLACVGVAGLAAGRLRQREREVIVRRALGASAWDLFRQGLLEIAPLVFAGSTLGLLAAPAVLAATLALLPLSTGFLKAPEIDVRVAVLAGALASISSLGVAAGALRASRRRSLAAPGVTNSTARLEGFGRALVAAQTGLAFVLTVGGALLVTSLWRVWQVDPGYDTDRLVVLEVAGLNTDFRARQADLLQLHDELMGLPGVAAAGILGSRVLSGGSMVTTARAAAETTGLEFQGLYVDGDLWQVLGLRALRGRLPTTDEIARRDPVVLISERAAAALWSGEDAIGRTLYLSRTTATVIGVVRDVELSRLGDAPRETGQIYHPGVVGREAAILLRTVASPGAVLREALRLIHARPQEFDLLRAGTMEQALADSIHRRRFAAWIYGGIAVSALVIVGISILGLVAMLTSLRTREIGVRIALGATRSRVVRLCLQEQIIAVVFGLIAGAVVATWTVRGLRREVFGISATDPIVWTATAFIILIAASLGTILPALRASAADPVRALRVE